jgi:phosphoribosylformylglycinamidine (FGAM) synthase-like enzyme
MAIAEVCRNLVCSGAEPIGITDCLNFGNPERPDVMHSFARAIDGLAAACTALGVPIVSGNVSLYNETDGKAILPTPTVAAVGLLHSIDDAVTQWWKRAGDVVLLLGTNVGSGLGGSEYLYRKVGRLTGAPPRIDLDAEKKLQHLVLDLARAHVLESAHDIADGGLAVALAECCATAPSDSHDTGARIDLDGPDAPEQKTALLFGEAPSRVVISVKPAAVAEVSRRAEEAGVKATELGVTGGDSLSIAFVGRHGAVTTSRAVMVKVKDLREKRERCLEPIVGT